MAIDKKKISEPLRKQEILQLAMNNLPVGVGLFQLDGRPIYVSGPFREIYQLDTTRFGRQHTFEDLLAGGAFSNWKQDPAEYFRRARAVLEREGEHYAEVEICGRIIAIHDRVIEGEFLLSTQQDITSRVRAEQRATHLANHDSLTGLPNRAAFSDKLIDTIEHARATGQKMAILSVDVDRFKDVNDLFGHAAGDALLQEMARRFLACAGEEFVSRHGGDEFTFISFDPQQPEAGGRLAQRLLDQAAGDFEYQGNRLNVGLSIGVAVYPDDGRDAKTLLSSADAALYRAKAEGRGVSRFFEPEMDRKLHEQRRVKQDLRVAFTQGEFALHYQPQATVAGEVFGFEALLRWLHPKRGYISPSVFIPVAEESGLIVEIGEWLLREACREAASWSKPLRISVNLSPVQFRHGDLATLVHQILFETGLPAGRLELEITEGVLVQDFSRALNQLRRLKALGVRIALDDFGTGYSSLSYLQSFPFDTLKIDQSFIHKLEKDQHSNEIVKAVIGLGRGMCLPVIAEGVETAGQLAFLAGEKCQSVQGYFIGRPNPIDVYSHLVGNDGAEDISNGAAAKAG